MPVDYEEDTRNGPPAWRRTLALMARLEREVGKFADIFGWVDMAKVPATGTNFVNIEGEKGSLQTAANVLKPVLLV